MGTNNTLKNIPAPPPGFVVDVPIPPPPPGFTLDPEQAAAAAGLSPREGVGERLLSGLASGFGLPSNMPPLHPAVEMGVQAASGVYPIAGPIIRDSLGQIVSGNVAGGVGNVVGTVAGTVGPALVTRVFERLGLSKGVQKMAETQYGKFLYGTKNQAKEEMARVIPKALDKGVTAFSLRGMAEKAGTKAVEAAKELDVAYATLPPNKKISITPIWDRLDTQIKKLKVPDASGQLVAASEGAEAQIKALEAGQERLLNMADRFDELSPRQARKWRQILDRYVKKRGKMWENSTQVQVEAQKELANGLREELNKLSPDIKKLDDTYFMWSGLRDLAKGTMKRQMGQQRTVESMKTIAGGVLGSLFAPAVGVSGPIGGAAGAALELVIKSPKWRTVSAVVKSRVADQLAAGNVEKALLIASPVTLFGIKTKQGVQKQSP